MRKRLITVLVVMCRSERFYLFLVVPGGIEPALLLVFDPQVFLVSASQISVVRKNMFPQWRTLLDSAQSLTLFARILQSDWHCMLPSEKTTREQQKEKNLCSRFQRPYFSNDLQN